MSIVTKAKLKGYFETGDVPSQAQYADLIDSKVNLSESNTGDISLTGNVNVTGNITASAGITSSGTISASLVGTSSFGRGYFQAPGANAGVALHA